MTYRILLIDADAARAAKRRGPFAEAGHDVMVAGSPDAALACFDHAVPHLVVIDATGREDAIRDLCGQLKKRAAEVPLVLLTDVEQDPQQVSLVLNQYGCDQMIDRSLSPDRMLKLIDQLVVSGAKPAESGRPKPSGDPGGATLWLDSEELVNALEKLDTIITHKAAGQVQATGLDHDVLAHVDAKLDRDVQARREEPVDGGADIDDHLNSVFSRGLGTKPAAAQPPRPAPPAPREPVAVKTTQAARATSAPKTAHDPSATVALPVITPAAPKPSAVPIDVRVAPATAAAPASVSLPEAPAPVPAAQGAPASTVRWLIAATVVVTLLGAGYLVLFRGGSGTTTTVASSAASPAQAPPLTPGAGRSSDSADNVKNAGPLAPVTPPIPATPRPTVVPMATPQATARPTPRPAAKPTATPKPVATPKPTAAPKLVAAPKPTPEPAAAKPVTTSTSTEPAPIVAAPSPTPAPRVEPPPAPVLAQAQPAPTPAQPEPVVPPTVVRRAEPTYSPKAAKGIADPRVVLKVLVDTQGRIVRVLVDKGIPGSELEAAAVSAVLRWQYAPGTRGGQPVEAWTTAEFKFGE